MKNFVLIGVAGYVAPRHMKAIKEVGGNLVAAYDPHDSVGILDNYFPNCEFFTEFERFDRHIEKLQHKGIKINYVSIASPNYLHDAHCRWSLRIGADAICEKPLVINERNLDGLLRLENDNRIWSVLQLRLHPSAIKLSLDVKSESRLNEHHKVIVKYVTPRGKWYNYSWKGNIEKSGGLATNIGVHLFDIVTWLFGDCSSSAVYNHSDFCIDGFSFLENAEVTWRLSIEQNEKMCRIFNVDDDLIDLSSGFKNLHTEVYKNILNGNGFGIEETRQAIRLCETIRCR